ncbi:MAG TPA: phage tail sheath C-terminal domain-containing protein [Roseiarcus sp.]|nr:phage tail sheath C-terminal domain-containing protein [Roseiarcus sp.]
MRGFPYNNSRFERGRQYRDIDRRILGARFLVTATDEQWSYVSIRRLVAFIERSIANGTSWAVFEPNGPALWGRLQSSVGAFLQSLYNQGALQGSTPPQAFFVNCGPDTTTQADIDNGIVNIVVGVAPVYPAEFVIIAIGQWASPPANPPVPVWPPLRFPARRWPG